VAPYWSPNSIPPLSIIRREPALIGGLVQAALAVLVAFGAPVTDDQSTAILGLAAVIAAIIGVSVGVRASVTPTAKIQATLDDKDAEIATLREAMLPPSEDTP
jgi:hypothetical protein